MISYDKSEIRESLTLENIFQVLEEFGGEPTYSSFGIISRTICHNHPDEAASRKLYYYENSKLFRCYTECGDSFDIFELVIKIFDIQKGEHIDLNEAIRWVSSKFNIINFVDDSSLQYPLKDEDIFKNYERIRKLEVPEERNIVLPEYDSSILSRFNYDVKILPWLNDGISQLEIDQATIGYYPKDMQITIPHFDVNGRFIGLRGRSVAQDDAQRYGKYRPVYVNHTLYNHPLGMNLYNLNNSKSYIRLCKKAVIFESEKSTLQFRTQFGDDCDFSVACCGNNLSSYQVELLLEAGAEEIILGFDRQFEKYNTEEYKRWKKHLLQLVNKYRSDAQISIIFDKQMITKYKDSPTDNGKEVFEKLFKERIIL